MHARRIISWIAAVLALGPAVPARSAERGVLLESFGSVGCDGCSPVRNAIASLELEYDFRLVAAEYHVSGPLFTDSSIARHAYYGSPPEPSSTFDGVDLHSGSVDVLRDYRETIDAHLAATTPVRIEAAAVFTEASRTGSLSVLLEIDELLPDPGTYRVRAMFLEDGVSCCGAPGAETFPRVARLVLPDRPLTIGSSGEIQFEQWDAPLEASWVVTNLRAITWIQRDSDRAVLTAVHAADAGGLQPLPTSGLDESRVTLLPGRPNPLRTGETRFFFTLPRAGHARVRVLNANGRVVRVLTDGPRPNGVHSVRWDGTDYTGRWMASGIYFVRLETHAGVLSRKLTLVR